MNHFMNTKVGAVVIGRNEGERLRACLSSIASRVPHIVYVDSGSTDASVQIAESLGAHVLHLAADTGFSAARARNSGFDLLAQLIPELRYVQFIDGDCVMVDGWIEAATETLRAESGVAAVCGRRREEFPEASYYNRLCDMEWNAPIGDVISCGGDALMRADAFREVGGFNPHVIAGEEPELCARLRRRGWRIQRIEAEMTRHDAAMFRFWQWWQRCKRSGHAYAQGAALHGHTPERFAVRPSVSIWLHAFVWPLSILLLLPSVGTLALWGMFLYPALWAKTLVQRHLDRREPLGHCMLYALSCVLAKWPQWLGQIQFIGRRILGQTAVLIEYKHTNTWARRQQ